MLPLRDSKLTVHIPHMLYSKPSEAIKWVCVRSKPKLTDNVPVSGLLSQLKSRNKSFRSVLWIRSTNSLKRSNLFIHDCFSYVELGQISKWWVIKSTFWLVPCIITKIWLQKTWNIVWVISIIFIIYSDFASVLRLNIYSNHSLWLYGKHIHRSSSSVPLKNLTWRISMYPEV